MAYTPAQARAAAKWDRENTMQFSVKVNKSAGEQFKALVSARGDTVNGVLCQAIRDYIRIYGPDNSDGK